MHDFYKCGVGARSIGVCGCAMWEQNKCATAFAPLTKGVIDCSMCWKAMVNPICITTLATRIGARFVDCRVLYFCFFCFQKIVFQRLGFRRSTRTPNYFS